MGREEMKHIVGLSGGKDSTALALRLRQLHPEIEFTYICTPTGNEPAKANELLNRRAAEIEAGR
jgi:tRNA(Ile)-lysidine synthase TilS/MesJ